MFQNMVWRSKNQHTFGNESDLVGSKVFDESTMPYRLFGAAHEGKNIGKKKAQALADHQSTLVE